MKKVIRLFTLLTVGIILSSAMTSCESDDYWYDDPGYYDTFYDQNLTGYWELVQVDSHGVVGYDKNYLSFSGRGYGEYYYWDGGRPYVMPTGYVCQYSNSGVSDYQMNLAYGDGRPTTINYWFTNGGRTLWMQWREYDGYVSTYVYDRIYRAPW